MVSSGGTDSFPVHNQKEHRLVGKMMKRLLLLIALILTTACDFYFPAPAEPRAMGDNRLVEFFGSLSTKRRGFDPNIPSPCADEAGVTELPLEVSQSLLKVLGEMVSLNEKPLGILRLAKL